MKSLAVTGTHLERLSGIIYMLRTNVEKSGGDDTEAISDSLLHCYYEMQDIAKDVQNVHYELYQREQREKQR